MKTLIVLVFVFLSFESAYASIYSCRDSKNPSSGYILPLDISQRMVPFYVDRNGQEQVGYKWDIESLTRLVDGYVVEASLVVYGSFATAKGNLRNLADGSTELQLEIWGDSGDSEKFVGICQLL